MQYDELQENFLIISRRGFICWTQSGSRIFDWKVAAWLWWRLHVTFPRGSATHSGQARHPKGRQHIRHHIVPHLQRWIGRSFGRLFSVGVNWRDGNPICKIFTLAPALQCFVDKQQIYQVWIIFWHNCWSGVVLPVSNRMKRSNLQKRDKTCSVLRGGGGERISSRCRQVTRKVPKPWKISLSYSFAVGMGHFDMVRWKNDCLYFQHVTRYIGADFLEESRQKMQRSEKGHFFTKGALIGKSIFLIQRINAVRSKCSSSGVLRHIPSHFTRSIRRRIAL